MNWLETVYSDGSKYFVSKPIPQKGDTITIKIRVKENDDLEKVILRTRFGGGECLLEMQKAYVANGLIYYETSFKIHFEKLTYHFYLLCKDKMYYYNQKGISDAAPNEFYDFKILVGYRSPEWVKGSVFYQIFPDRFFNGNQKNDCFDGEYTFDGYPTIKVKDWNSDPLPYDQVHCLDFYGGDLEGIKAKIPYLKALGVNALYLNPIFMAATVHKYDCYDYFHVDPHFGGDQALQELVEELHKNNMHLILDVSINHTGIANKWFNKEGTFFPKNIGAFNNPNSKERKYYFFNDQNEYTSWAGVPTLPNLNYENNDLRKIIYESEDSLVKKYVKAPFNTDGWRFDVADVMARNYQHELHHEIWPGITKSIKDANPNAYILAEEWCDCEEFLRGNEWDSPMNYFGCGSPIRDFIGIGDLFMLRHSYLNKYIGKGDAKKLGEKITTYLSQLPFVMQQNQFNLIDSHDVTRLHNYNLDWRNYQGAIMFMFSLIGTPSIYYGDELGIKGDIHSVEGCRYPMPWSELNNLANNQFYQLYSKLAHLKQKEDALIYGGQKILSCEDSIIELARFTNTDLIITIFSMADEDKIINLNLESFGNHFNLPNKDLLGEGIEYITDVLPIQIKVKAHQSYILKISNYDRSKES